ncbi:MAG: hypothetical protein R2839_11740 [Thermomicrobiales bacterium]
MFQDLHIFDVHAHFPIRGDVTQGGKSLRTRDTGEINEEATATRLAFREEQLARTRQQWRMAFDFPEPEAGEHSSEEQAARWVTELDKYGIERIGFVTGRDNDELARWSACTLIVLWVSHTTTSPDQTQPRNWNGPLHNWD